MSEALNVTKASFGGLREVTTAPLWQYDYGQILQITGLDLPQAFEVHFSNSRKSGETVTQIGSEGQVVIPDMFLTSGADIYAFVFLHDGEDDGETEYVIKIPVRERPEPSDIEPTPEQQDAITEAIAALNVAVTKTGQDVISADASATAAAQSATNAQTAATQAQGSATAASASATTASNAANTATTKASEAATSAANAAQSAEDAESERRSAANYARSASDSAGDAVEAKTAAQQAANTATAKASEASTSASNASGSASAASLSASQASDSATQASQSATAASGSATTASGAAGTASTKASEASASATAAQTAQAAAETAAATFETDTTLSVSGKAADAKATGDAINNVNNIILGEPTTVIPSVAYIRLTENGIGYVASGATAYNTKYFSVKKNQKASFHITAARNGDYIFGFAVNEPAANVAATYLSKLSIAKNASGSYDYTPQQDGYFSVSFWYDTASDITATKFSGGMIENMPVVDDTLTHAGEAADAKATGDAINLLASASISKTNIATAIADLTLPVNAGKTAWNGNNLVRRYAATDTSAAYLSHTWGETSESEELDAKTTLIRNLEIALSGGEISLIFEQGSTQISGSYIVAAADANVIRTRFDCIPYLLKGDTITVADGYIATIIKINADQYGIMSDYTASGLVIPEDGLYFIRLKKSDNTAITPSDGKNAVSVTCNGLEHLSYIEDRWKADNKSILPKNPYYKVPFRVRRSSSSPWVYGIHEVISCSHCHCETQADFENLQAHYDHVAISNYYPSVPWYPLSGRFENVGNTLGSPNAEHGMYRTGEHINAIGSYISSPIEYGSAVSFIEDARKAMKMANGGGITINHPKWTPTTAERILSLMNSVNGIIGIEVWNSYCEQLNGKGDSSEIWDAILSTGTQIFATAVPDHALQGENPVETYGFGYNHMLVTNRSEEEILVAYKMGRFYTTKFNDGLTMTYFDFSDTGLVSIEVSEASTYKFITATRTVEVTTAATSATFQTQDGDVYVRVEVDRGDDRLWTNAVML